MAFSSARLVLFLASVLLPTSLSSSFTSAGLSHNTSLNDPVKDICSETLNPPLCFRVFKSAHWACLPVLCLKSIDLAQSNAHDTHNMISSLVKRTTDQALKEKYKSCLENYDGAIFNLDKARKSLDDPQGMNLQASAAMTDVHTCEGGFGKTPVKPPKLKQGNEKHQDLCSIILVISNLL